MSQPMVLSDNHNTGATTTNNNSRPYPSNHFDHSRSNKRRCRNQKQQQQAGIRDCYEESMANTPKIRHHWFFEIPTLQKWKPKQPQNTTLPQLQQQLQALDTQLQQVKVQFQPASEHCAAITKLSTWKEFGQARTACNPYEALGETRSGGLNHGLFLNRSAIKLANMDALLHFGLLSGGTPATTSNNNNNNNNNDTFYFVDLCAAPGGFSEYLLRRSCHEITQRHSTVSCRGYGMSLVGNNVHGHGCPWKLTAGPMLMGTSTGASVSYQICTGQDGTGDILQWSNVECLQRKIAVAQGQSTLNNKPQVALVCADGGVDAQRNVNHQEGATEQLVVCQVAAALSMLQPKGRFILKLLACQSTPILQRVLQELHDTFETMQVLKPISSRPASAERYLVCSGYQPKEETTTNSVGPAWIQRVMTVERPIAPELATFLATVDRDLMQLNLRACTAILSHLQDKTARLATPAPTGTNMTASLLTGQMEEDDDAWIAQGYQNYHSEGGQHKKKKVNVNAYKKAWRLF